MRYLFILLVIFIIGCNEHRVREEKASIVEQIVHSNCGTIDKVYYEKQEDTITYNNDIKGFVKYWDTRYTEPNEVSICEENLRHSTYIDTRTNSFPVEFGGPQSTFIHRFEEKKYPWRDYNNLMFQVEFDYLKYLNLDTNIGGTVSFNMFIKNESGERINYVVAIYALGQAWKKEQSEVMYDPTTRTSFIGTVLKENTQYITLSPYSNELNYEKGFFRGNISHHNLKTALSSKGLKNIDLDKWYLDFIGIQFELEEEGGDAILYGEFKNFECFITNKPI